MTTEAYPGVRASLVARFWSRVQRTDGCWLWSAALFSSGYGAIQNKGKGLRAHRVSWEIHNGPIPDGMMVLHRCDNRRCVRPDHLFIGTHSDNMNDRQTKGRQAKGVYAARAKLSDSDVKVILYRLSIKHKQRDIARDYGISKSQVGNIHRGESRRTE